MNRCTVCHGSDELTPATTYPDGWTGPREHVCADRDGKPSPCAVVLEERVRQLERPDGT